MLRPPSPTCTTHAGRWAPVSALVSVRHAAARHAGIHARFANVCDGDQVPPDKRSLALRVVIRSPERTLSEKDIAGVRARIVGALARDCGAALR